MTHRLLACLSLLLAPAALAAPLPEVRFQADVLADGPDHDPRLIRGRVTIRNWEAPAGRCLYLRYEDPDYGEDTGTARRFEMMSAKSGRLGYGGGGTTLRPAPPVVARLGGPKHLLSLETPPGWTAGDEVTLSFEATVPRLPKSHADNWFYDGFLPELLGGCLPPGLDPSYYRMPVAAHVVGDLRLPPGWEYAGPGAKAGATVHVDLTGRTLAFALSKGYAHREFKVGATPVTLYYHTPAFADLEDTVRATFPTLEKMFGPYPYPTLTIVETGELERQGLPGVIAMNKPHQFLFDKMQRSWLNWHHWIFTLQLAREWYGGGVAASTPDDDWLIAGTAEFGALEALAHDPAHFNLFSAGADSTRFLSFDYLQASELTAATLHRFSPFATLTTPALVTKDPAPEQYPLLFIKHAFALRQLKSLAGEPAFFAYLKGLTGRHLHQTLSPPAMEEGLARLPSPFPPPLREDMQKNLSRWWTEEGWPDFNLTEFEYEQLPDGHWVAHLRAEQESLIDFAPLFGVTDESGRQFVTRGVRHSPTGDGGWRATIITPDRPVQAKVDPTHEAFDADRFNNRSGAPELSFFPGGAETLRDDAYTIVWWPDAHLLPGEPYFIGLNAALFRYVQDGLLAKVGYAPNGRLTELDLNHSYSVNTYGITGALDLSQSYLNDRVLEASARRSPIIHGNPEVAVEAKIRHKERVGEAGTAHGTLVGGIGLHPTNVQRVCTYRVASEFEKAPRQWAQGFTYERVTGLATGDCYLTQRISLGVRSFRGVLKSEGAVPQAAQFKPTDLQESRLLLSRSQPWVNSIVSVGSEVLLPFYLPLPSDTMILARQMRWRVFYDWGHAFDTGPDAATREMDYRSAGFGLQLPLGGDLSGAGALALRRVSVMAVVFDNVGGIVTRKPSVFFDLTGQL